MNDFVKPMNKPPAVDLVPWQVLDKTPGMGVMPGGDEVLKEYLDQLTRGELEELFMLKLKPLGNFSDDFLKGTDDQLRGILYKNLEVATPEEKT